MPSAEVQLLIRARVLAQASTPDAAINRSSTFWEDSAREFGLIAPLVKRICSAQQGERSQACDAAKKVQPYTRGNRRHWKRLEAVGKGRRMGAPVQKETGKRKTNPSHVLDLWQRVKVWAKMQEANAREVDGV